MKRAIKFLLISTIILVMLLPVVGLAEEDKEVAISDANFKNALRELCGIAAGEEIYMSDVEKLSGNIDLSNNDIQSANGIKYLVNATSIDLSYNNVSEIRGDFSGLVNLKSLNLSHNDMYNKCYIYIEDIPNLEHLDISANKMTYLVDMFGKLSHLQSLDISANRMTDMSIALLDFNLLIFNCDYNFFDLSDGSKDREILDMLHEKGCDIHACKQLVKLPEISYSTDGSKLVAKWKKMDDVPFYDGSKGEIVGYTVLLDGKFQKSVSKEIEEYTISDVSSGTGHKLSVTPDYNITEYGDFKIRSYTVLESVVLGKSGPTLEDAVAPIKHENYYDVAAQIEEPQPTDEVDENEADTSSEPVLTYDEQEPEETVVEQDAELQDAEKAQETFTTEQPEEKSTNLLLLISLLVVILVLIAIIAILLIKLWRNKNYVGKDEIDYED